SDDKRHRAFLVKPMDVPTYVEYGAADIGIAGRDVLLETGADVLQPLDLRFGYCRIALAGFTEALTRPFGPPSPEGRGTFQASPSPAGRGCREAAGEGSVRVATKYPRITLDYYNARGTPVEIIPLSGSIELAPLIGLADRIVDVVETGRTL